MTDMDKRLLMAISMAVLTIAAGVVAITAASSVSTRPPPAYVSPTGHGAVDEPPVVPVTASEPAETDDRGPRDGSGSDDRGGSSDDGPEDRSGPDTSPTSETTVDDHVGASAEPEAGDDSGGHGGGSGEVDDDSSGSGSSGSGSSGSGSGHG